MLTVSLCPWGDQGFTLALYEIIIRRVLLYIHISLSLLLHLCFKTLVALFASDKKAGKRVLWTIRRGGTKRQKRMLENIPARVLPGPGLGCQNACTASIGRLQRKYQHYQTKEFAGHFLTPSLVNILRLGPLIANLGAPKLAKAVIVKLY